MNAFSSPLIRVALVAALLVGGLVQAQGPKLLHSPRSEIQAGHPLVIDGTLIGSVDQLRLHYRVPGTDWHELPMELQYGDLFRAVIPGGQVIPPHIEYFVDGTSFSGRHLELFRSALKPAKVDVIGQAPQPMAPQAGMTQPPVRSPDTTTVPNRPPERQTPPARSPESHPASNGGSLAQTPPDHAQHGGTAAQVAPQAETRLGSPVAPSPRTEAKHAEREPSGPIFYRRSAFDEDLAVYSAVPNDAVPVLSQPEAAASSSSLVFDRDQIRALGARTVFDVLDVVPGLSVSRDVQGNWRVAFRGLRGDSEVLFLLDGHRLNNFYDGRALANLPVDNLERIEVIRGPGAVMYGANAFLGVVKLVTDHDEGARATLSAGSFGALNGHFSGATHTGKLQLFLDADALKQDGYSAAVPHDALDLETIAQGRDPGDPAGMTNDSRELVNVGAGFKYGDAKSSAGLELRFLRESRRALIGLFDTVGPDSHLGWSAALIDATFERWFSERFQLSLRAFADLQSTDRAFQLAPDGFVTGSNPATQTFPGGIFERFSNKTRTLGLEGSSHIRLAEGNQLGIGVQLESASLTDYAQELNLDASDYTLMPFAQPADISYPAVSVPAAVDRLALGLFAEDVWSVGRMLQLDFGFRLDAVQLPTPGAPATSSMTTSFNPRAGLSFTPVPGLALHLRYERAFRAPTVEEYALQTPDTFFTHGQYEGNPDLVPATVDGLELGGDLVQRVEGARIHIQGNLFLQSFTHPIAAVDTSGNIVPLHNREGVRVYGAEGSARVELSRRASAWVNASFFRAEDTETPDQFDLLTDVPQARFNAGLTLPLGPYFDFDVFAQFGSERRNLSRSVLEQIRRYTIPAYSLVTAQVRTEKIADHFELALVGHNVFDEQRYDDVPRPDRILGLLPREGASVQLILTASY